MNEIRYLIYVKKYLKIIQKSINQEFILEIFKFALEHFFFYTSLMSKSFDMYDSTRCKCIRNHVGGRSIRCRWADRLNNIKMNGKM